LPLPPGSPGGCLVCGDDDDDDGDGGNNTIGNEDDDFDGQPGHEMISMGPPNSYLIRGTTYLGYYDPNLSANMNARLMVVGWPTSFMAGNVKQVILPGLKGLHKVPTETGYIGTFGTYALPLANGGFAAYDIQQRRSYGMLSQDEAILQHTNNAAFTTLNVSGVASLMNAASNSAGPVTLVSSTSGTAVILSSPATIIFAVPSIGLVTAWEQQTINNMIEGMPREQAWKLGRDTVYEPVLNVFGATRQAHPEWYWYPNGVSQ
jgi:hypothetical protein